MNKDEINVKAKSTLMICVLKTVLLGDERHLYRLSLRGKSMARDK